MRAHHACGIGSARETCRDFPGFCFSKGFKTKFVSKQNRQFPKLRGNSGFKISILIRRRKMNKEFDYNVLDEILKEHNPTPLPFFRKFRHTTATCPRKLSLILRKSSAYPRQRFTALQHSMRISPLNPRARISFAAATARLATFAILPKFLTICARNSAFPQRREQRMTLNSPLKQFHVSAHAVLHRSSP